MIRVVLYTAKSFWPGMTADDIRYAAARAREGVEPGERAVVRGLAGVGETSERGGGDSV
jgi:hypothetical protein